MIIPDEFCAITEGSDKTFHSTRLAIASFIDTNRWFNGTIIIMVIKENPLSKSNLNLINQVWEKLEIVEIPETDLLEVKKKLLKKNWNPENLLDYLYPFAFDVKSYGTLYFSRNMIFQSDISDMLNEEKIKSPVISPNFPERILESRPVDPSLFYVPKKLQSVESKNQLLGDLSNYNLFQTDSRSVSFSKILENRIEKIGNQVMVRSSTFPDKKYRDFIRHHKSIKSVLVNSLDAGEMYKRINHYYASMIKKYSESRPIRVIKENLNKVNPVTRISKFNEDVTVIIPAFNAWEYLEDCVSSIVNQKYHKNIEILIGVDSCPRTRDRAVEISKRHKIKVFFNESGSVGPYIIRNSLIESASNDCIIFFDADDIMSDGLVNKVTEYYNEDHPVRFKYYNFNHGSDPKKSNKIHHDVAHGVFMCSKKILDRIGGFQPWICGADTEFMKRCSMNGIRETRLEIPLFYRRIHPKSLTQNGPTNHRSRIRIEKQRFIKTNRDWTIPISRKKVYLSSE